MSTPNPIKQAITLANTIGALQALVSATQVIDPGQEDRSYDNLRTTLNDQIRRYKAELDALISLYGG